MRKESCMNCTLHTPGQSQYEEGTLATTQKTPPERCARQSQSPVYSVKLLQYLYLYSCWLPTAKTLPVNLLRLSEEDKNGAIIYTTSCQSSRSLAVIMYNVSPSNRDKGCLARWKTERPCGVIWCDNLSQRECCCSQWHWVGVLCGWPKDLWGYISYASSFNGTSALWERADWEAKLPGWLQLSTAGVRLGKLDNWSCSLKR